jgi:hypothetical protein
MNISIALKLILLLIFALPGTNVFGSSDLSVFVAGSAGNVGLDMKATESREVSGFVVKPESVVQIVQGENLVVFTVPTDQVEKVKLTDTAGVMTELVYLGNNAYSLSGFAPGVYVLDVIADLPNGSERAAYETILVILKPGEPAQQPTQVINKIKVVTDVRVTFEDDDDNDKCSDKVGSAGMGFPYEKKTECEKQEWDQCIEDRENGIKWADRCKDLNEGFFDDCEGYANKEECDEYWDRIGNPDFCEENPDVVPCNPNDAFPPTPPICDENTPPDTLCRDEGDPDTCDEGFVDKGFGCEPEEVIPEDPEDNNPRQPGCVDPSQGECYMDTPGNDLDRETVEEDEDLNTEESETEEEEPETEEVEEEETESEEVN